MGPLFPNFCTGGKNNGRKGGWGKNMALPVKYIPLFFLHQIACLDYQESIDTLFAVIGKVGAELCPREVPKKRRF